MVMPRSYLATFTWPRLRAHRKSLNAFLVFLLCCSNTHKLFSFRINGIAANKFERVCGHKGYSYDAFHDNDKAANIVAKGGTPTPEGRSRVWWTEMDDIGYEDCDWVSNEVNYNWCKYIQDFIQLLRSVPHH